MEGTEREPEDRRRRGGVLAWGGVALLLLVTGAVALLLGDGQPPAPAGAAARPRPTATPEVRVGTPEEASVGEPAGSATAVGVSAPGTLPVTARVLGNVAPGTDARLAVTVRNPSSSDVLLTAVTVRVTDLSAGGCRAAWYRVTPYDGSRRVPAGSAATLELPVTFVSLSAVNQDACKGARYRFAVDVQAVQA